jgi:cytochrome bd-type quinol oxidase subunit 1
LSSSSIIIVVIVTGKLSWSSMSKVQRTRFALQEKAKGNECFKAGEADASLSHYSR